MLTGFFDLKWWELCVVLLMYTHITISAVTLYLHRSQAHKSIELSSSISHFFRFWLWLTTGMNTKEWTAIHRKHHAMVDKTGDPHSPAVFGLGNVLWKGAELYRVGLTDNSVVAQYGYGTPNDWVEKTVYSRYRSMGVVIMFVINFLLFGFNGITITAIQMCWIPFFAAGVINGVGHSFGYRNLETPDYSTNLIPFGVLIGGEELHNNHHAFSNSAKFSMKPWEFDLGWFYINLLVILGQAKVRNRYAGNLVVDESKSEVDHETTRAVTVNRLRVLADYGHLVIKRVYKDEYWKVSGKARHNLKTLKGLLTKNWTQLTQPERLTLYSGLQSCAHLWTVYFFRETLIKLYENRSSDNHSLTPLLKEWCSSAEETGIRALQDFAAILRRYTCDPSKGC